MKLFTMLFLYILALVPNVAVAQVCEQCSGVELRLGIAGMAENVQKASGPAIEVLEIGSFVDLQGSQSDLGKFISNRLRTVFHRDDRIGIRKSATTELRPLACPKGGYFFIVQ